MYVLSFFNKGDTIQGGDIIQGWTLFKEIRYEVAVSSNKFVQYSTVVCLFQSVFLININFSCRQEQWQQNYKSKN